ncbi:MAG: hypothetical protein ACLTR6_00240 [Clostridium fessum]
MVFPVRGLTVVFLFIMGLAAAVMAGEDAERGFAAVREPGAVVAADGGDRGVCIFSIHFDLCSHFWRREWGKPAFRGGKAASSSGLRDHVCLLDAWQSAGSRDFWRR